MNIIDEKNYFYANFTTDLNNGSSTVDLNDIFITT